jgi:hypothetical protein
MFNDGRRDAAERSLMSAFVFIIVQKRGPGVSSLSQKNRSEGEGGACCSTSARVKCFHRVGRSAGRFRERLL